MTNTDWYLKMATAIGRRAHAENMVGRWQDKVSAAEAEINALKNELPTTTETEQVQE